MYREDGCLAVPLSLYLSALSPDLLEHLACGPVLGECVESLYQFAGAARTKNHSLVAVCLVTQSCLTLCDS